MLKYNLERLFIQWGITHPAPFLIHNGFTKSAAYRLASGKVGVLDVTSIQKLCLIFKCTPDDLMEWVPEKPEDNGVSLSKLIRNGAVDLRNVGFGVPQNKLEQLAQKISEAKKELLVKE